MGSWNFGTEWNGTVMEWNEFHGTLYSTYIRTWHVHTYLVTYKSTAKYVCKVLKYVLGMYIPIKMGVYSIWNSMESGSGMEWPIPWNSIWNFGKFQKWIGPLIVTLVPST